MSEKESSNEQVITHHSVPGAPPIADCPPDTVQLFQFAKGEWAPSISPFVLKVETYLRLANIPYQNDHFQRFSATTNKIPWIRYNGEDVPDSTLIIEYLNEKRGVDLNKGLTTEQRGICTAFERMVDEHVIWILSYAKWMTELGFQSTLGLLGAGGREDWVKDEVRPFIKQLLHGQGMGRHPQPTILGFCEKAMNAIANFLGDKQFMMGDEPTQVDCSVFAMMAEFLWYANDGWTENLIPEKFPTIKAYCERMKERVWPDWDQVITHGK